MAELTHREKETIVVLLAQFRGPAQIAQQLSEETGLEITVQQVVRYDPTRPSFDAGQKWKQIFDSARGAYLSDISRVPVAHQGYRLRLLQEAIDAAQTARNWKLVADLLEQAAREVGGALTNKRQIDLADDRGGARHMSSDDRAALLGALVAQALARKAQ